MSCPPDSTNGGAVPANDRPFRLTAPTPSENDVEAGCKTILEFHNYWYTKLHAAVTQTLDGKRHIHGAPKGTPDYVCLHGQHRGFLLEVKRPGGRLSDAQKAQIAFLRRRYQLPIVVVNSPDELCNFLAQHERSP